MIRFLKPSPEQIQTFLTTCRDLPLSYAFPECTRRAEAPPGFVLDRYPAELGQGRETFERARRALLEWRMFPAPWTEIHPPGTAPEPGTTVAVLIRALGLWFLNAARVLYVVDESGPDFARFGFAYGTLPRHMEAGEELWLIEWSARDDRVRYQITAVSRPRHPLARLAYPLTRYFQKRFGRDSRAAMLRAANI